MGAFHCLGHREAGIYRIKHRTSTPYHPQADGRAGVTDGELGRIVTETVKAHRRDWAEIFPEAFIVGLSNHMEV